MGKRKKDPLFGLNEEIFLLVGVMHRLELLEKLARQGYDSYMEYSAFQDLVIDIVEKEANNVHEILEELNKRFPSEAVDLN